MVGNNASYHNAYFETGCSRNAKTHSASMAEKQRSHSRLGSISSLLARTKFRVDSDSNHSANIVMSEIHGHSDSAVTSDLDPNAPSNAPPTASTTTTNPTLKLMNKFKMKRNSNNTSSSSTSHHQKEAVDDVEEHSVSVGSSRSDIDQSAPYSEPWHIFVDLKEAEIRELCHRARELFAEQPMLLELEAPLKVVGDIHGQYFDLLRIFEFAGFPSPGDNVNYLFLGDYVDRGKLSIETIVLLFSFKVHSLSFILSLSLWITWYFRDCFWLRVQLKYPLNFFMLRGNHEAARVNQIYGFYDECKRRFSVDLWKRMCDVFNCLPVCALVEEKVFCMHGGLSPELKSLDIINRIQRPTDIPDHGLLCDLLWSDPDPESEGWGINERGVSYTFGKDVATRFLRKHDLDLIVRAHQVVEDGYEFFAGRRLVTVFSAPNYCGEFDNAAGIMSIDQTLCCSFQILQPLQ